MTRILILSIIVGATSFAKAGVFEATTKSIPMALSLFESSDVAAKVHFTTLTSYAQEQSIVVQFGLDNGKSLTYTCTEYTDGSSEKVFCAKK